MARKRSDAEQQIARGRLDAPPGYGAGMSTATTPAAGTRPATLDISGTKPVSLLTLTKVELRKMYDTRAGLEIGPITLQDLFVHLTKGDPA